MLNQLSSNKKIETNVIDDVSTDESLDSLKYYKNQVKILKNKKKI